MFDNCWAINVTWETKIKNNDNNNNYGGPIPWGFSSIKETDYNKYNKPRTSKTNKQIKQIKQTKLKHDIVQTHKTPG